MSEQKLTIEQTISGIEKTIEELKDITVVENSNHYSIHYGKYRICGSNHPVIAHEIEERFNRVIFNIKQDLTKKLDAAKEHLEQTELKLFPTKPVDTAE